MHARAKTIAAGFAYLMLVIGVGWFTGGSEARIARAIGAAFTIFLFAKIITIIWSRWKKNQAGESKVFVLAIVMFLATEFQTLRDTVELKIYQQQLRYVPADALLGAMQQATNTNIGAYFARTAEIANLHRTRVENILQEADDPRLEGILRPTTMASQSLRIDMISLLDQKLGIISTIPARLISSEKEMMSQINAISSTVSPSIEMSLQRGMNESLDRNRPVLASFIDAMRLYYVEVISLLRYLETPSVRPILNERGILEFRNQAILNDFNVRAERVDARSAELVRMAQQIDNIERQQQERMRRALQPT